MDALMSDRRLVRSGVLAASSYGVDLAVLGGAEAYVRRRDIGKVQRTYGLSSVERREANTHLHVVDASAGEWLFGRDVAPAVVVAVDLLERGESRAEVAGAELAVNV